MQKFTNTEPRIPMQRILQCIKVTCVSNRYQQALGIIGKQIITKLYTNNSKATIQFLIVAFLFVPQISFSQAIAFPGAEGFGRYTTGGRGGKVFEVTNLNDNGTGSLRAAVIASGARTVVFRVSGTIKLLSTLRISHGDITIAGQTAPGDGICLRDHTFRVEANNVIIRYIRSRLGDSTKVEDDAFSGNGGGTNIYRNIIIDHCSMSWAVDECSSFYDNAMFTMQWCFITESFYHSTHSKGNHGYGGIWGGWKASFHHNLLAHNTSRNPRFNGSRYTLKPDSEIVDFRNNVIYNWGFNSVYGGEAGNQNIVANYNKYGPGTNNTSVRWRIVEPYDTASFWYIADNYIYGNTTITSDNWNGGVQGTYATAQKNKRALTPFPTDTVTTDTPADAYELVLNNGGANLPKRDTVDARIVNDVRTGTAALGGVLGAHKGMVDSISQVGGWPVLNSTEASIDSDHDGIPDDWENTHGLNSADSSDGALIAFDGYSHLEHYINRLVSQFPDEVRISQTLPSRVTLNQNYPNPFNPTTTIEFTLPSTKYVTLDVFNVLGVNVARLIDAKLEAGVHYAQFDGAKASSGIYMMNLTADGISQTRKMILLK